MAAHPQVRAGELDTATRHRLAESGEVEARREPEYYVEVVRARAARRGS